MSSFNQHLLWRGGGKTVVKLNKIKDKEILKATNEKKHINLKGLSTRMIADF